MPLVKITTNLKSKKKQRHETLDGKEYRVVEGAMLQEGVLNGSQGPILYLNEDIEKFASSWDHKPAVVYHPEMDGQPVSACIPSIIESHRVGLLLNTEFDGKLRMETWLDEEKTAVVDNRIIEKLDKGEPVEVSTGLYVDIEQTAGEHKGTKYVGIARNYRPDHLALLPDQTGALSVKQGGGLLANADTRGLTNLIVPIMEITSNEMSFSNIRSAISTAITAKYGYSAWVRDVYSKFLIYCVDGPGCTLYKLSYTVNSDNSVTLGTETPEPVVEYFEYRTSGGAYVGNASQTVSPPKKDDDLMDKKQLVDKLIGNAGWAEHDRETLMTFDTKHLEKMLGVAEKQAAAVEKKTLDTLTANERKVEPPAPAVNKTEDKTVTKPLTAEEYINNAPPAIRELLANGVNAFQAQKNALIATIVANKRNTMTKEYLDTLPVGSLAAIAALAAGEGGADDPAAPPPMPNFFGAAGGVQNSGTKKKDEFKPRALGSPVINFSDEEEEEEEDDTESPLDAELDEEDEEEEEAAPVVTNKKAKAGKKKTR